MKKTFQKIGVISAALLALTISVNAQWTRNAVTGVTSLTFPTDKVGIGTPSPSFSLDIKQDANCSFRVQSKVNGSSNMILSRSLISTNCLVNYKTGLTDLWFTGCINNDDFRLRNASSVDVLYANQAGNVGIGTTTPTSKLQVAGNSKIESPSPGIDPNGYCLNLSSTNFSSYPGMTFVGAAVGTGGAGIFGITSTGFTGINVGDQNGGPFAPVNASAFNVSSDRRMKKNIADINSDNYNKYLNYIRAIESATFLYNSETEATRPVPHIGVIAQSLPAEVQAHITELAGKSSEARLGVSLADMQGLMIVGIKAIDAKQTEQEKIIADQQKQIDELKAIVSACGGANASQEKMAATSASSSQLFQNSPNPFNQTTVIRYALNSENTSGKIIIRDLSGNLVKQVNIANSGKGQVTINANELNAGTYTYTLEIAGASVDTKLMVVTK